jgi:hypothetical protein
MSHIEWETAVPFGADRPLPQTCSSVRVVQSSAYIYADVEANTLWWCSSTMEIIGAWFDSAVRSCISQGILLHHQMQEINQYTLTPCFRLFGASPLLRHVL